MCEIGCGKNTMSVRVNQIRISKNFTLYEFESPDTRTVKLDRDFLWKLQELRDALGRPIIVHSGFRTDFWNTRKGGAPDSFHKSGKAGDISSPGMSMKALGAKAASIGFRGVIVKDDHVHVDTRNKPYTVGL